MSGFGVELARFEQRIKRLERASNRFANVSIDGGSLPIYDSNGNIRVILGEQPDGSYTWTDFNGTPPPAPSTPTVSAATGGLVVVWDGATGDGTVWPNDFMHTEIHLSTVSGFTPDDITQVGVLPSLKGGVYTVGSLTPGAPYYVTLVAVNTSRVESVPSVEVSGVPATAVDSAALDAISMDVAAAQDAVATMNRAYYSPTEPSPPAGGFRDNDQWWELRPDNSYRGWKWSAAANSGAGGWVAYQFGSDALIENSIQVQHLTAGVVHAEHIAAGEVNTTHLGAQSVTAEQIDTRTLTVDLLAGGTLKSNVSLSGSFETSAPAGYGKVRTDPQGLSLIAPDGQTVSVSFPTDPGLSSSFAGSADMNGLVVNGLEVRGDENVFAMGSTVVLEASTTSATLPPVVTLDYPTTTEPWLTYMPGYRASGVHVDQAGAGAAVFVKEQSMLSAVAYGGNTYEWPTVAYSPGAPTTRVSSFYAAGGVTGYTDPSSASTHVLFGIPSPRTAGAYRYTLRVVDLAPVATGGAPAVEREIVYGTPQDTRTAPVVGHTSTPNQVCTAEIRADHTLLLRRYDASTGTLVAEVTTAGQIGMKNPELVGVYYGSVGSLGATGSGDMWLFAAVDNGDLAREGFVYAVSSTGNVFSNTLGFPMNGRPTAMGSRTSPTGAAVFYSAGSADNLLTTYTDISIPSGSPVWHAAYTWVATNTDGSILHETTASKVSSFTMRRRARLTLTTSPLPDPQAGSGAPRSTNDVKSPRVYLAQYATPPTSMDQFWSQPDVGAGVTTVRFTTPPVFGAPGAHPPTTSGFPTQSAAVLQSSAYDAANGLPKLVLSADGFSHFEALDVTGAGSTSFSGIAFDQLFYALRAQSRLTGGGTISVSGSYRVKWSSRFTAFALGRAPHLFTSGRVDITVPPAGTTIAGYGGAANTTAATDGIPVLPGQALWYVPPYNSAGDTTENPNFRLTGSTGPFIVPNDWILLCAHNVDNNRVEFVTGDKVTPGTDSTAVQQLVVASTTDANTSQGNKPPLIIGDTAAQHLRADGNEVISMSGPSTIGNLSFTADRATFNVGDGDGVRFLAPSCNVYIGGTPNLSTDHGMVSSPTSDTALVFAGAGAGHVRVMNAAQGAYKEIWASQFQVQSDPRSKSDRSPVVGALGQIMGLSVEDYLTPHGATAGELRRARGVMADDVERVAPHLVSREGDTLEDRASVDVYGLLATLVAAVQELVSTTPTQGAT